MRNDIWKISRPAVQQKQVMTETPLILGHRGASAVAPENTLAAFARAIDDGADGIEFDVRLSRDGVPVVIHDETLKRTGLSDRFVCDLTAQELGDIDVGSWFTAGSGTETFAHERLPMLDQVFDLFSSIAGELYVEMKCDPGRGEALAAGVVNGIEQFGQANRVVVESFDLLAIAEIKKVNGRIRTAALFEPRLSKPILTVRRLKMIEAALDVAADEIALHRTLASPHVIEKAKEAGLKIVVWTVDDPRWISRARALGIKALIANNPAKMVRHRNSANTG
jgi:glycerophosphoryl diester phosphodiesterase